MTVEFDNSKLWGMVAYTDGGCNPNPGPAGSGGHIYFYEYEEIPEDAISPTELTDRVNYMLSKNPNIRANISTLPKPTVIDMAKKMGYFLKPSKISPLKFSDGDTGIKYAFATDQGYAYCSKDGAVSSVVNKGVIPVAIKHIAGITESSSNRHTNNYAEIKAMHNAIKLAQKHQVKRLHIVTDSEFTINGLTKWYSGWVKNNWVKQNGEMVKNKELWEALHTSYTQSKADGMIISISWIKAHADHPGNLHADHLATISVMKSIHGEDSYDVKYYAPKEYWEPKRDKHPLMSLKRLYFSRLADQNTPGVYYMADPGKDDSLIGKPLPEAVFAIVKLKEPIPLLSSIFEAQSRYGQDFNATMMIKMDSIYDNYVYRLINDYGDKALLRAQTRVPGTPNRGNHVIFPDKRQITIEKTPIGITMRAIDSINSLEAILDHYLLIEKEGEDSLENNLSMQIHDMTEDLYDKSEKKDTVKYTLKKDIIVGQKTFSISRDIGINKTERTITIPLRLGADLPDRNNLKRLETYNPQVSLITWRESSNSLRYAAVLKCDDGIAIWSNFYADRLMFKE